MKHQVFNLPELVSIIIWFIINGNVFPVSFTNSIPHNMCNFAMINTVTAKVMRELSYELPCDNIAMLYIKLVQNCSCVRFENNRIYMLQSELCGYVPTSAGERYYRGNELFIALNNRILDASKNIRIRETNATRGLHYILDHMDVQSVTINYASEACTTSFLYEENSINVVVKKNISSVAYNDSRPHSVEYSKNCLRIIHSHRVWLSDSNIRFPLVTKLVVKSQSIIISDNFLDIFPALTEFVIDCANGVDQVHIDNLASKYGVNIVNVCC
jgi:hypothetical protein